MANRTKRNRSSRKRRSSGGARGATLALDPELERASTGDGGSELGGKKRSRQRPPRERARGASSVAVTPTHGERPRPAWHPLPISELLILAGAIAVVVAFQRGVEGNTTTLLVGIAAVALGTLEVTIREHRSGFRSHTIMLAALPVVVFHSVGLLIVSLFVHSSYTEIGLFAIDLVLFVVLFRLLRSNFLTARMRRPPGV